MCSGNRFIRCMLLCLMLFSIPGRTHTTVRPMPILFVVSIAVYASLKYTALKDCQEDVVVIAQARKVHEQVTLDHGYLLDAFDQDSKMISQYAQKAEIVAVLSQALQSLSEQRDILDTRIDRISRSQRELFPDHTRIQKLQDAKKELQLLIDRMRKVLNYLKVSLLLQKA